jgi:hypothetical protein
MSTPPTCDRALTDLDARSHVDQRVEADGRAHHRPRLHHAEGADAGRGVHARVGGDHRGAVDAGGHGRGRVEQAEQRDERLLGRGAPQGRGRQIRGVVGGDEGAGARGAGRRPVARAGQEGDLIGPGALQRRDARDDQGRITVQPCL